MLAMNLVLRPLRRHVTLLFYQKSEQLGSVSLAFVGLFDAFRAVAEKP